MPLSRHCARLNLEPQILANVLIQRPCLSSRLLRLACTVPFLWFLMRAEHVRRCDVPEPRGDDAYALHDAPHVQQDGVADRCAQTLIVILSVVIELCCVVFADVFVCLLCLR